MHAIGGWVYYYARDYDEAIRWSQQALQMDPDFNMARSHLGLALLRKGMHAEAVATLQEATDLAPESPLHEAELAHACAVAGRTGRAQDLLWKLRKRAIDEGHFKVLYLKVDPAFDAIRSDPRVPSLVRRAGLAPD